VAGLLVVSGVVVAVLMDETDPHRRRLEPAWQRHPELLGRQPGPADQAVTGT
jgi:hypothetical protein